MLCIGWSK